ncbi:hypothetical protein C0992_005643 [Termitomyces sp. T32_za158]|nr:hypothetical protein C0992_005643 [Termitomyces sp. T32_za158]
MHSLYPEFALNNIRIATIHPFFAGMLARYVRRFDALFEAQTQKLFLSLSRSFWQDPVKAGAVLCKPLLWKKPPRSAEPDISSFVYIDFCSLGCTTCLARV